MVPIAVTCPYCQSDRIACEEKRANLCRLSLPGARQVETYEEILNQQMLSLLDEAEEKIESMLLRVVFADGHMAHLAGLQIYPSAKKVSSKVLQQEEGRTYPSGGATTT